MHFCFVSTTRGSPFMTELLRAIALGTEEAGHTSELALDAFPATADDSVYIVIPHEFQAWADPHGFPDSPKRARTIALCTENAGTEWFEATYRAVPAFAAAASINRSSAAELERRGLRCDHIQLGYSALWDTWQGNPRDERPLDVLYLGAADARRDSVLAGLGGELWARNCQLLVPPLEPRTRSRPDFLEARDKYERLRASRVLLNLHRSTSEALEWMRFLEAIANGCVVVSEPCSDQQPLLPGRHFLEAPCSQIAGAVNELLDDPARLDRISREAYDFTRRELSMRAAGERLAWLASRLPRSPPDPLGDSFVAPTSHPQAPINTTLTPRAARRARPKRPWSRRERARAVPRRRGWKDVIAETRSFATAMPQISAVCVMAQADVAPLESVARSLHPALEMLVVCTPSTGAQAAAERFVHDRADLPTVVLEHPGGGRARGWNLLAERSRGARLLFLDDGAVVYPSTVARLAAALDGDLDSAFAYPMVATRTIQGLRLSSALPWEPERLRVGNWIEPLALFRRREFLRLGGFSTDPGIAGWEDYDLWCRCAEVGLRGAHVAQVLARRTRQPAPDAITKWALMRERFPTLFGAAAAEPPAL
jgi:hypothetical protein